ncbi:hypothetical protein NHQ30_002441 [Ciborinia camelliae]|nr:hypothetical protein NHQ30_002441 [Ciborinia camelliae]
MFESARDPAKARIITAAASEYDTTLLPSTFLPERYHLQDLYRELVDETKDGKDEELENILILASCLEQNSNLVKGLDDEECLEKLEDYLTKRILPNGNVFSLDRYQTDGEEGSDKALKIKKYKYKYILCIVSISLLLEIFSNPQSPPKNDTLLSVIPFATIMSPWTTTKSHQIATAILEKHNSYVQSPEFLVTYLLKSFIRRIFSEAPAPKSVTASSRKAAPSSAPPPHFDVRESSPSRQPWRSNIPYTIPVLQWIIESITPDILRKEGFPLLIPPLLTLLDSPSNSIRIHTLNLLPTLFPKMGDKVLLQTGLGDVFEDAIHPVLLFLPSLTPVEDTSNLLPAGYQALYALLDVIWPGKEGETNISDVIVPTNNPSNPISDISKSGARVRLAFLDRIMRHAILPAHHHCQEIPSVVEILIAQIGIVIAEMGIWGVKHLKDILPIMSKILMDPFLPDTSPSLVIKTLETLRGVIIVLSPRIGVQDHRLMILEALGSLYCQIRSQKHVKSEEIKLDHGDILRELQETGRVFVDEVRKSEDQDVKVAFQRELDHLIKAYGELANVFQAA